MYLSGHPIDGYRDELRQLVDAELAELKPSDNREVTVAGLVVGLRVMHTRRGDRMAFVTLDDKTGRLELAVFSELFSERREKLRKDKLLLVRGTVSVDEYTSGFKMAAESIYDIEEARLRFASNLVIRLNAEHMILGRKLLERLQSMLSSAESGQCGVVFKYATSSAEVVLPAGQRWRVAPTTQLLDELEHVVGDRCVRLIYRPAAVVANNTALSAM